MKIAGQSEGTSEPLTLHDAASAITGMLSDDYNVEVEDKQTGDANRTPDETTETVETPDETDSNETTDDEQQVDSEDADETVDDAEADDSTTPPEPRKIRVKLPDGEQELPEDEVARGYLRQADYTRKTQELADKRKAFEADAQAVVGERQRYATQLAQLDELLTSAAGDEPDWDSLRNEDPAVFAATYAAWDHQQKRIAAVRAERQRAEQQVQADHVERLRTHIQAEAEKLVEAIPEWKKPDTAKAEREKIADYARSYGYTDQELGAVTDHRLIRILRDAMLYRQGQNKKPAIEKKIEQAKVLAPGSSAKPRVVPDLTKAKQRLAKTGSMQDAGAVIAQLLDE